MAQFEYGLLKLIVTIRGTTIVDAVLPGEFRQFPVDMEAPTSEAGDLALFQALNTLAREGWELVTVDRFGTDQRGLDIFARNTTLWIRRDVTD